jgi:hypothetical protein
MEHPSLNYEPVSPEHSLVELLRVTLLLMKPYAAGVGSQAEVYELESVMRHTIDALERADSKEESSQLCRTVLQFRRPARTRNSS